ncbi:hypothetical protein V8C40DRAFT_85765 [Trichoderma camerunense]
MVATLQGPENWHDWIMSISRVGCTIWDLVDPSKEQKSTPLPPPVIPTYKDVNSGAVDTNDLTVAEILRLNMLHAEYLIKLKRYEEQQEDLATLRREIANSVGGYGYLIAGEYDLANQLAILSNKLKPSDEAYRQMISDRYYAALRAPVKSTLWDWYFQWLIAYETAKGLDLPDTNDLCATRLVLRALASIYSTLSDHYEIRMEDLAQSDEPGWYKGLPEPLIICKTLASRGDCKIFRQINRSANVLYESQRAEPRPPRKALILQQRRKPSERTELDELAYRNEVAELYYYHLSLGIDGHKLDDYLKSWRKMITEARRLGYPPISNSSLVFHFLEKVSPIYWEFAVYWKEKEFDKKTEEGREDSPDPIALSEMFERCFKRKVLGQIDTLFGFGPRSYDFKLYQPRGGKKSKPPKLVKAAKPTGSPKSPCLCGMQHFYTQCFYLVDEIRPIHWMPYTDVASKVFKQLKNPYIRAKVVKAMEKRGVTMNKVPLEAAPGLRIIQSDCSQSTK